CPGKVLREQSDASLDRVGGFFQLQRIHRHIPVLIPLPLHRVPGKGGVVLVPYTHTVPLGPSLFRPPTQFYLQPGSRWSHCLPGSDRFLEPSPVDRSRPATIKISAFIIATGRILPRFAVSGFSTNVEPRFFVPAKVPPEKCFTS